MTGSDDDREQTEDDAGGFSQEDHEETSSGQSVSPPEDTSSDSHQREEQPPNDGNLSEPHTQTTGAGDSNTDRKSLTTHPAGPPRRQSEPGGDWTGRDPVQEAFQDTVDLYEIATWEARSRLDKFAVRLTNALISTRRVLLLIIAISLFVGQLIFASILIVEAPIIGLLGVVSAVPALLLAGYFWLGDPTTREPIVPLAATFVLAVAFSSIAGIVNSATLPFFELFGALGLALFYFLIVGPIEEFVKWLAIRVYAYRTDAFRTVVDGVVYGAMAGVGFAAIENLLYIIMFSVETTPSGFLVQEQEAIAIATQRAFVGPGHVIFSAWAGFYLGLAKFNQGKRGPIVVKGLLIAAFIHGLYNTLVTSLPLTLETFLLFLIIFHGFWFALLYRKIKAYQDLYNQRPAMSGVGWE